MWQGKGCSSTRKDFGLTWDVQDEMPIVLAVMVSLRVALEEIKKCCRVRSKWYLLGVKWRSYHAQVGLLYGPGLIQVVVNHQILPTSSIRNVQGPVGGIFMLRTEFIEFLTKFSQRGLQKKNLYRPLRSIFTLILTLLYILTFLRSFSVLCSLFSSSNFCLMRSCCFSWASCSAFNYDENIYVTRYIYINFLLDS